MAGSDWLNSDHQYRVGDPCWILVDQVNSPTGCWRGEIVFVADDPKTLNGVRLRAKITDLKIQDTIRRELFGREPSVNYRVMPSSSYIDALQEQIASLKTQEENLRRYYQIRETVFKEALAVFREKS